MKKGGLFIYLFILFGGLVLSLESVGGERMEVEVGKSIKYSGSKLERGRERGDPCMKIQD